MLNEHGNDDWTRPPANYTEWLHRVNATLIMCRKRAATGANYRRDPRALYAEGATPAQAAVAFANEHRTY